jgi:hypothetical protein
MLYQFDIAIHFDGLPQALFVNAVYIARLAKALIQRRTRSQTRILFIVLSSLTNPGPSGRWRCARANALDDLVQSSLSPQLRKFYVVIGEPQDGVLM